MKKNYKRPLIEVLDFRAKDIMIPGGSGRGSGGNALNL